MLEQFIDKKFSQESLNIIYYAEDILNEYRTAGFKMTLRQLYYQFVSRGLIPNTVKEYDRMGRIISDARLAGHLDWDILEDRTRNLSVVTTWNSPKGILEACAQQYNLNKWANQDSYIEVWVEKEAMAGIVEKACSLYDVSHFCCRGYVSQSEMYFAAKRLLKRSKGMSDVVVIYLGDHDPSGIDMTRDIEDRLMMFTENMIEAGLEIRRIALNMDQVEAQSPPPNPAKTTDSRFKDYQRMFGSESWELDALDPQYLVDIIRTEIEAYINMKKWNDDLKLQEKQKTKLQGYADNYRD